jgi:hypothetical protein
MRYRRFKSRFNRSRRSPAFRRRIRRTYRKRKAPVYRIAGGWL